MAVRLSVVGDQVNIYRFAISLNDSIFHSRVDFDNAMTKAKLTHLYPQINALGESFCCFFNLRQHDVAPFTPSNWISGCEKRHNPDNVDHIAHLNFPLRLFPKLNHQSVSTLLDSRRFGKNFRSCHFTSALYGGSKI